jgi:hypothetical protein
VGSPNRAAFAFFAACATRSNGAWAHTDRYTHTAACAAFACTRLTTARKRASRCAQAWPTAGCWRGTPRAEWRYCCARGAAACREPPRRRRLCAAPRAACLPHCPSSSSRRVPPPAPCCVIHCPRSR